MEEIVTEIESRERGERGTKRKTTTHIPTPIEKDNQKKLKKGEPPGVGETKSMEQRLDRLESMATEQQETNTELRNLMKQVLDVTTTIGKESKSNSALTIAKK